MSFELLAEFDAFYKKSEETSMPALSALDDLSCLSRTVTAGSVEKQPLQAGWETFQQWPSSNAIPVGSIWGEKADAQPPLQSRQLSVHSKDVFATARSVNDFSEIPSIPSPDLVTGSGIKEKPRDLGRQQSLDVLEPILVSETGFNNPSPLTHSSTYLAPHPPERLFVLKDSDVLRDAAETIGLTPLRPNDDDDFGEFESVMPQQEAVLLASDSAKTSSSLTRQESKWSIMPNDLLALSKSLPPSQEVAGSLSHQERNAYSEIRIATKYLPDVQAAGNQSNSASLDPAALSLVPSIQKQDSDKEAAGKSHKDEETWQNFARFSSDPPNESANVVIANIRDEAWASGCALSHSTGMTSTQVRKPPPSNIPPPSLLLSLFLPIFDSAQCSFFKPIASHPFPLRNHIISEPSTLDFLRGYLLISTVVARIIAGRKFRWRRDTLLSQAMKIGSAAIRGMGGMKLKGIDKAEASREDREVAEIARNWKDQVGKLRSTVAIANGSIHDASMHFVIPEISMTMRVMTLADAPTAPNPCIVCGLKREERVAMVDMEVEDSFEEWWVEHWGHKACRNFWLQHEGDLKQRK